MLFFAPPPPPPPPPILTLENFVWPTELLLHRPFSVKKIAFHMCLFTSAELEHLFCCHIFHLAPVSSETVFKI
jgi:hypothetical protein